MPSTKKKSDLASHFKKRISERYGIEFNRHDYNDLCERIRIGKGKFLHNESNSRSHWMLWVNDQWVYVVYNKNLKALATALPKECLPENMDA